MNRKRLKRMLSLLLSAAMLLQLVSGIAAPTEVMASGTPANLIINQSYGGGGKSDTPISHSFIEIYNPTGLPVSLQGWRVEYSSARSGSQHLGTTVSQWVYKELAGTIPPHTSYLIRGAAEPVTTGIFSVQTFDLEWEGRYIDNDQYNLRLVNGSTVVDQVTVKEAVKDGGEGPAIASINKHSAVRRVDFRDTNNNGADFAVLDYRTLTSQSLAANRPRSLADGRWGLASLMLNQVYGGGGKSDTPISHSFIEIYNPTGASVSLDGWRVEYSSARVGSQHLGTTVGEWVYKDLTGSIPSYTSYLIRGAAEPVTTGIFSVQTYDLEWAGRYIDNDQYNVRLVNGTKVVDQVTVKEAVKDGGEGPAITAINKHSAVRRVDFRDTNSNAVDFAVHDYRTLNQQTLAVNRPRSLADGQWGLASGNGGGTPNPIPNPNPNPPLTPQLPVVPTPGAQPAVPGGFSYLGSFSTGYQNKDGGVAEIVKFNTDNRKMYVVNGYERKIDIVSLADLKNGSNTFVLEKRVDLSAMIPNFSFGDITSIDINTNLKIIAAAVQEQDYSKKGAVVILDYSGNYIRHIEVGVQPDMVTFTPDGDYILTADEGEPRNGYGTNAVDPKGSVTIINLKNGIAQAQATIVTFDEYDQHRAQLVGDKVILKKNTMPSVDLEPEYIAVASNSKTAYVTLQEANAIATLDIENARFTSIKGLGFKDHSLPGNEIDIHRNSSIGIVNQPVFGVYMPDGLALAEIGGKTYLLTPNEGDARDWSGYNNVAAVTVNGASIDALKNQEHDGLEDGKIYILGGRSFAIWDADTMQLVYDSGSDFEKKTAALFPNHFNVSNDNITFDHRSSKKGPEPEDVKVLQIGDKWYAMIGLERIGGVMMYEITNPAQPVFFDYMNTRNFSAAINGDVGPEGLAVVKASDSPTGYPLVLAAHEVSGTVAVYQVNQGYVEPVKKVPYQLNVQKTVSSGMAAYSYTVAPTPGAPTYPHNYYVVVQVYEGSTQVTPGMTIIKKLKPGSSPVEEEIRIGQSKKLKIMVVSAIEGDSIEVLAETYGAQ